jgi:autotransporter-associated beta strand protein
MSGSTPTVTLTGANTYTGLTTINGGTLRLNKSGGTTLPTTNSITVAGGTLRISTTQTIANLDLSGGGNLTVDAGIVLTITGTYTPGNGTINGNSTGRINLSGSAAQSFPGVNMTTTNLGILGIANASGVTIDKAITLNTSLNLTSGSISSGGGNITMATGTTINRTLGTINASPVYAGTVNVSYNPSSAITTGFELPVGGSNTAVLNNLSITSASNVTLAAGAASIQINGILALSGSGASFGVSSNTITFAGTSSITRTGTNTINASNATANLTFTNTSAITIPSGAIAGSITRLVINGSGGVTLAGNQTIATALTLTSGTLTLGANATLTYSNTAGGLTKSSGNIDASNSLATVAFTNTTNVNLLSGLFTGSIGNLTINGVGRVTMQSAITVAGALTLTSGKLAIGSNTLTLNGTVSMDASNSLTGSTTSNLTIGGSGALDALFFDQTSNTTKTLNNLVINRTTSGTVSLGNGLRLVGELTPTAGVLTTGGNLRLLSSAIGTSAAIGVGSNSGGYISGTVDVERYSQAQRGYRTLAHPYTTAQTVGLLTDNFQITGLASGDLGTYGVSTGAPSALYYDGTKPVGTTSVLGRITKSDTAAWGVGKGLYVFIRGNGNEGSGGTYTAGTDPRGTAKPAGISPLTLDVTSATINQGDVTVTVTPYASGKDNYTLVGNPYPCPINLSGVTGIGSFSNIYLYNPTLSGSDPQILRGGFEQRPGKNIVIPSMGCFYIQSTAGTPATITFKESDKVASGTSTYSVFGTGTTTPKIGLEISTSAGFMDRTSIVFDDNAASTATDFYDGGKLGNNLVTFYSLSSERKALGIDYRRTNTADIIPLGIQTATATNYTISLSELTDLPNTQVVLRDKFLKTETILSQVGDSYSFAITADTATLGENRFEIGLLGTTVLPVQIADITAQLQTNKTVAVNWTSTTEVNLASYKVQRSKDGSNFSTVGTVAAKGASAYSYSDDLSAAGILPATIYYRLEAVDKDGSKTYSKVVAVALGGSVAKASVNIYPNPVQSTLFAQVTVTKAGAAQLKVVDAQGKIVATQKTQLAVGTTSISIPAAQLSAGNYVLEIETTDGKQTQRFVKE